MPLTAITRGVSPSIDCCELTGLPRTPIDLQTARRQHALYEAALASLGVAVRPLPEEPDMPDAVFVEDTAVVLDECAVVARPGAGSRRGETDAVARALAPFRRLFEIEAPATLDGGDVLCLGKRVQVGLSTRTNGAGVEQLRAALAAYGYAVEGIEVRGCLHLKSAVTQVAEDTLLLNPAWVGARRFPGMRVLEVDPNEPHAANALRVGECVLYQPSFPRTFERLERAGLRVIPVDLSELGKAEGALTCCSLVFDSGR